MKTIGMLGGMSWQSTAVYYRLMNNEVQERLGGVHSAKALMYSFDFDEIAVLQATDKWNDIADRLIAAATGLARGGADFLMICCNTQHLVSAEIERAVRLPLLHIADPLGRDIAAKGIRRVGLVGTSYTMEKGGVIADRLTQDQGPIPRFVARGVARDHGKAGRARGRGHHPRLHRAADAGERRGRQRPAVRHDHLACACGSGPGPVIVAPRQMAGWLRRAKVRRGKSGLHEGHGDG
jgi:hypothetical protein